MSLHMKVHQLLSRPELDELEEFAREPARTVDEVWHWLVERDFAISRGAVHNWKRQFDQEDRFRIANDTARAILDAARGKDAVALSDAATEQLGQIIFEHFVQTQGAGETTPKDLINMSGALKNLITSKRHLEKLEEEVAAKQKKAIDEASKEAASGASGEAVVQKVREILGVA